MAFLNITSSEFIDRDHRKETENKIYNAFLQLVCPERRKTPLDIFKSILKIL